MNIALFIVIVFLLGIFINAVAFENNRNKRSTRFKVSLPTVDHHRNNDYLESAKTNNPHPIVKTAQGLLRGHKIKYRKKELFSFSGVPYAAKPERFQAPKPFPPWDGVRNATEEGEKCMQNLFVGSSQIGSEDCLFLEVTTPSLKKDKKAVLVWIHGGSFRFGSGSRRAYGPQRLAHQNLVVVTINYRLDVLGWLSTGTKHAPGNAGLRDSVEALRWVKRNIENFGGDPENVCIHGMSSSGAMVDFLILSPMAKGLFHKAIISSGTTTNYWGMNYDYIGFAFEIGRILGVNTTNINKLGEIFQETNASRLLFASKQYFDSYAYILSHGKGPVVEKSIPGIEAMLTESPEEMITSGRFNDVPLMFTVTDNEGRYSLTKVDGKLEDPTYFNNIDDSVEMIIPDEFWPVKMTAKERMSAVKQAKKLYFNGRPFDINTAQQGSELYGDVSFLYSVMRSIVKRLKTAKEPIYLSQFSYVRPSRQLDKSYYISGVGHAEDLYYYYVLPFLTAENYLTPPELHVIDRQVTMVANFVKYGNPTPKVSELLPVIWKPLSNENMYYLSINETLSLKKNIFKKRVKFWDNLLSQK